MDRWLIYRVAHETNRAICQAHGDLSQVPWDEAPKWQAEATAALVDRALDDPHYGPEVEHSRWVLNKLKNGWVYGTNKNAVAKTHPLMIPWSELPREHREKDVAILAVVRALAE